jgi:hypothetical protein
MIAPQITRTLLTQPDVQNKDKIPIFHLTRTGSYAKVLSL